MTELCQYHSLAGVAGGRLDGPMAKNKTTLLAAMRKHRAVSGAGDHGAVMLWTDDEGQYRCAFMRYQQIVEQQTFTSLRAVDNWLKAWLPAMASGEFQ